MADKHPIKPPSKPNKDPEGTQHFKTKEQKTLNTQIKKDNTDNNNPDGAK